MTKRLPVLVAAVAAALLIVLFGSSLGGEGSTPAPAAAAGADIGTLVEQFSASSTAGAVSRLERDAGARPDDARAVTLLGLAYVQRFRETGDASWLGRAESALAGAPSRSRDALSLTARAQLANVQHRFRAAIPLARRALRRDPGSAAALGALGDGLLETGRHREAFAVFDRMVALGPSVGAYARVAIARRLLGHPEAAIDAVELALEAGSAIPEQRAWAEVLYGTLLLQRSRIADAERAFRRSLAAAPGYLHAQAGLARVEIARGRFGAASRRLRQVVARLPLPQYAILLGDVLERAGRTREAERAYGLVRAIERLFAAQGVRTELQTALFDLDRNVRVEAALRRARAAFREAPGVAAADAVAWGLVRAGRCREAAAWSRRVLRQGRGDGLALFHAGMAARCLGDTAGARHLMREALAVDPHFSVRFEELARRLARGEAVEGEA